MSGNPCSRPLFTFLTEFLDEEGLCVVDDSTVWRHAICDDGGSSLPQCCPTTTITSGVFHKWSE